MDSDKMYRRIIKPLTLSIAVILLSGCATQETSKDIPEFETASEQQCTMDCDLTHSGTVRACSRGRLGPARDGLAATDCVNEAYTALRICYRGCN